METVKEMATSREPSEADSSRMAACLDTTIVVVDVVVNIPVEVITTSRVNLEGCNHRCQVVSTEEAEAVEECTKVEATTKLKVAKTSKAISKIRTTTTRPSNANSLKAAEIVLTGISVPLRTDSRNCR